MILSEPKRKKMAAILLTYLKKQMILVIRATYYIRDPAWNEPATVRQVEQSLVQVKLV
jgi:hypothetical protein